MKLFPLSTVSQLVSIDLLRQVQHKKLSQQVEDAVSIGARAQSLKLKIVHFERRNMLKKLVSDVSNNRLSQQITGITS